MRYHISWRGEGSTFCDLYHFCFSGVFLKPSSSYASSVNVCYLLSQNVPIFRVRHIDAFTVWSQTETYSLEIHELKMDTGEALTEWMSD